MLTRGYPPVASPLGFLMFLAGCRSYCGWYISEGGREGPRKLQCFKPLNEDIRREEGERLREERNALVARPEVAPREGWPELACRNAREGLGEFEKRYANES